MRESLEPALDDADNVIIVTVAWKGVIDVKSLQKPHVKLAIMPDFRPFLSLHRLPDYPFYFLGPYCTTIQTLLSFRILPCSERQRMNPVTSRLIYPGVGRRKIRQFLYNISAFLSSVNGSSISFAMKRARCQRIFGANELSGLDALHTVQSAYPFLIR